MAGSLYIVTGLVRRGAVFGLRWSAGRPGRRVAAAIAALACVGSLTVHSRVAMSWPGRRMVADARIAVHGCR